MVRRISMLAALVVVFGVGLLALPANPQRATFCRMALPLYEVEGIGQVITRDLSSNGPRCVIEDEDLHFYADSVIVDFDCSVTYPEGWTGDRPAEVEPADVDGYCGRDPRLADRWLATWSGVVLVATATGGLGYAVLLRRRAGDVSSGAGATSARV